MEHPEWFFMWTTGSPYITSICGWTKKDVIRQVEEMNVQKWKKTYAMGGRVVRVKLQVCPTKRAADLRQRARPKVKKVSGASR